MKPVIFGAEKPTTIDHRIMWIALLVGVVSTTLLLDENILFRDSLRPQSGPTLGHVTRVSSDVRRKFENQLVWHALYTQDVLLNADSVFTGTDSEAELALTDGSRWVIAPGSLVILGESRGEPLINIQTGSISGHILAGTKLLIQGSSGVVGEVVSPGGVVRANAIAEGVDISVLSGAVEVNTNNHVTKAVEKQSIQIGPTIQVAPPTPKPPGPKPLPAPEGPSQETEFELQSEREESFPSVVLAGLVDFFVPSASAAQSKKPELRWSSIPGAQSYEVQISRSPSFEEIIATEKVQSEQFTWMEAKPGIYYWRIRGFDASGAAGIFGSTSVLRVFVPAPLIPEDEKTLEVEFRTTSVELHWKGSSYSDEYELQTSQTKDFKTHESHFISKPPLTIDLPSSGVLFWKIRSVSKNRDPISKFSGIAQASQKSAPIVAAPTPMVQAIPSPSPSPAPSPSPSSSPSPIEPVEPQSFHIRPKAGLEATWLSYSESSNPKYLAEILGIMAGYETTPLLERIVFRGDVFYDGLTLHSNSPSSSMRLFGGDFDAGYRVSNNPSLWFFEPIAGGFFRTTYVTDSAFGYHNLNGIQAGAIVRGNIDPYSALWIKVLFSPNIYSISDNELSGQLGWNFKEWSRHPIALTLNYSRLKLFFQNEQWMTQDTLKLGIEVLW